MSKSAVETSMDQFALCVTRGFTQIYLDDEILMVERHKNGVFIGIIFRADGIDPAIERREDSTGDIEDLGWQELEFDLKSEDPVATIAYRGFDPRTGLPVIGATALNG